MLVKLVGIRIWWGSVAQARLQAEINCIKAAGEPLFVEDFQRPPVADEDNVAWYLLTLADIMPADLQLPVSRFSSGDDAPPVDENEYFHRAAEAIALVRPRATGGLGCQVRKSAFNREEVSSRCDASYGTWTFMATSDVGRMGPAHGCCRPLASELALKPVCPMMAPPEK